MRKSKTLILLCIVLALAALAWLLTTNNSAQAPNVLFPQLTDVTVLALDIKRGDTRLRCERAPQNTRTRWRIVEPHVTRADDKAVKELISALSYAVRLKNPVKAGEDYSLAEYGLDRPTHVITLEVRLDRADKRQVPGRRPRAIISFGAPWRGRTDTVCVGLGANCEKGIFVTRASLARRTNLRLTELLQRNLLPDIELSDLQEVTITAGDRSTRYRNRKGLWMFNTPDGATDRASTRRLSALIDHLAALNVEVEKDAPAAPDDLLGDSVATVTVKTHAKTVRKLEPDAAPPDGIVVLPDGRLRLPGVEYSVRIGGPDAKLAMVDALPVLFRLPELGSGLRLSAAPVLDTRLLQPCSPGDVYRIEMLSPAGMLVLLRFEDDWYLPGLPPDIGADGGMWPRRADGVLVENILSELLRSRLTEPRDDAAPRGTTDHLIVLRDETQQHLASVEFRRLAEHDRILVRRPPCSKQHYATAGPILGGMKLDHVSLRDRTIITESEFLATSVTVRHGGRATRARIEKADARRPRWVLSAPAQGAADEPGVAHILRSFRDMRAERFVAPDERMRAALGLAQPAAVTVVYSLADGRTNEQTLLVGSPAAASEGGHYARVAGSDEIFVLPAHIVDGVPEHLASRTVSQAGSVVRLRVTAGGAAGEYAYDPKQRAWADARGAALSDDAEARLAAALELLADFQAERVAAFSVTNPAKYGFDAPRAVVEFDVATIRGKKIVVGADAGGGLRYIKGPISGYVLLVPEADAQKLTALAD